MGRHSSPSQRSGLPLGKLIAALLVVAVAGVSGWALVQRFGGRDIAEAATSAADNCGSNRETVRVATTPDMQRALNAVANRVEAESSSCVNFLITAAPSALTMEEILTGQTTSETEAVRAWIPDSPMWVQALEAQAKGKVPLKKGDVIATSPLVVAVPKSLENLSGQRPWVELATQTPFQLPNPLSSSATLVTMLSGQKVVSKNPEDLKKVKGLIVGLPARIVPESMVFFQANAGADKAKVFPATEQQIIAYNSTHPSAALHAMLAAEGNGQLSYPWVTVAADGKAKQGLDELYKELTSDIGRQTLARSGFRAEGTKPATVEGISDSMPALLPDPTAAELSALNNTLENVAKPTRMLAIMDVSGSMAERDAAGGRTRAELAVQAAGGALLLMNEQSQIGLWGFSTARGPSRDWFSMVPMGPVDGQHRQRVLSALQKVPGLLGGDTGLHDSILAGYKEVQKSYDPQYQNSVVLLTDGVNDDSTGGLSEAQLLAELRRIQDPKKPVTLILIGMGRDTDQAALSRIAKAIRPTSLAGGLAYQADRPEQIKDVFIDATLNSGRRQ